LELRLLEALRSGRPMSADLLQSLHPDLLLHQCLMALQAMATPQDPIPIL